MRLQESRHPSDGVERNNGQGLVRNQDELAGMCCLSPKWLKKCCKALSLETQQTKFLLFKGSSDVSLLGAVTISRMDEEPLNTVLTNNVFRWL